MSDKKTIKRYLKEVSSGFISYSLVREHLDYINSLVSERSRSNHKMSVYREMTDLEYIISKCKDKEIVEEIIRDVEAFYTNMNVVGFIIDLKTPKQITSNIEYMAKIVTSRDIFPYEAKSFLINEEVYSYIMETIDKGEASKLGPRVIPTEFLKFDKDDKLFDYLLSSTEGVQEIGKLEDLDDYHFEKYLDKLCSSRIYGFSELAFKRSEKYRKYIIEDPVLFYEVDFSKYIDYISEEERNIINDKIIDFIFRDYDKYKCKKVLENNIKLINGKLVHKLIEMVKTPSQQDVAIKILGVIDTSIIDEKDLFDYYKLFRVETEQMKQSAEYFKKRLLYDYLQKYSGGDLARFIEQYGNIELINCCIENELTDMLVSRIYNCVESEDIFKKVLDAINANNNLTTKEIHNILAIFKLEAVQNEKLQDELCELVMRNMAIISESPFISIINNNKGLLTRLLKKQGRKYIDISLFTLNDINYGDEELIRLLLLNFNLSTFEQPLIANTYSANKLKNFIKITSIDDFNTWFSKIEKQTTLDVCEALLALNKYNLLSQNERTEDLNNRAKSLKNKVRTLMSTKFNDLMVIDLYVDGVISGKLNPFYYRYITTDKELYATTIIDEIRNEDQRIVYDGINMNVLQKVNKKQLKVIIKSLQNYNIAENKLLSIAIRMITSVGFARSMELLSKNSSKGYGPIDGIIIELIFGKIDPNSVSFAKDGKGYLPILNDEWINFVFGDSYKKLNTPIRNVLNMCDDYIKERELEKARIMADMSLSEDEKERKTDDIDISIREYKTNLSMFFNDVVSHLFNNWDIYIEEFYRSEGKTKLKTKFTMEKAVKLHPQVKKLMKVTNVDCDDIDLLESDVLEYVDQDSQFRTSNSSQLERAKVISKEMRGISEKKFPELEIKQGKYTARVYNPQDRRILSAGYRSHCCFRPCGVADNDGENNSLLYYCATTPYGGGIEIIDDLGNTVMFSPILRNGNVVMIHSIETEYPGMITQEVGDLLVSYAEKMIQKSIEEGDSIDFVFLGNLHHASNVKSKDVVPVEYKFRIFDENNKFKDMYNNLREAHLLIASNEGKTYSDIEYGPVEASYKYEKKVVIVKTYEFEKESLEDIKRAKDLKDAIIELTKKRAEAIFKKDDNASYMLMEEINKLKKEYLKLYVYIMKNNRSRNIINDYDMAVKTISGINKELGVEIQELDISHAVIGSGWYIVITHSGRVIANAIPKCSDELRKELQSLLLIRNLSIENVDGNISRT